MKVLLDECVPRKFKNHLPGHDCHTVPEAGFAGEKNGQLLLLAAAAGFQAFLSLDRGIEHEQNLKKHTIAIMLVRSRSSRLADLLPHVPNILATLDAIQPGQLLHVS